MGGDRKAKNSASGWCLSLLAAWSLVTCAAGERFLYNVTYDYRIASVTKSSFEHIVNYAVAKWNNEILCDSNVKLVNAANVYNPRRCEVFRVCFRLGNFLTFDGNRDVADMDDFDPENNVYVPVTMDVQKIYPYVLRRIGEMIGYETTVSPDPDGAPCVMCPASAWIKRGGHEFSSHERNELRGKAAAHRKQGLFGGKENVACSSYYRSGRRRVPPSPVPVTTSVPWERVLHALTYSARVGGTRAGASNAYNKSDVRFLPPSTLSDVVKVVSFFNGTLIMRRAHSHLDNTFVIALPDGGGRCYEIFDRANMIRRVEIALQFNNRTFVGLDPEFREHRIMHSVSMLHVPAPLTARIGSAFKPPVPVPGDRPAAPNDDDTIQMPASFPSYNPKADVAFDVVSRDLVPYVQLVQRAVWCNGHRIKYMFSWRGGIYAVDDRDHVHNDCESDRNRDGRPLWVFVQLYACSQFTPMSKTSAAGAHSPAPPRSAAVASVISGSHKRAVRSGGGGGGGAGGGSVEGISAARQHKHHGSSIVKAVGDNEVLGSIDIEGSVAGQDGGGARGENGGNGASNGNEENDDENTYLYQLPLHFGVIATLSALAVMLGVFFCKQNLVAYDKTKGNKLYNPNK